MLIVEKMMTGQHLSSSCWCCCCRCCCCCCSCCCCCLKTKKWSTNKTFKKYEAHSQSSTTGVVSFNGISRFLEKLQPQSGNFMNDPRITDEEFKSTLWNQLFSFSNKRMPTHTLPQRSTKMWTYRSDVSLPPCLCSHFFQQQKLDLSGI